jgi:hypothetical protein
MEIKELFKGILGQTHFDDTRDIHKVLKKIGVEPEPSGCRILTYKRIERALLRHYEQELGISLEPRIYSINEINGLVLFVYIKVHGAPDVDEDLEAFFERLFFGAEGESNIEELKQENERLAGINQELRMKIEEMESVRIDEGFGDTGFRSVESEVLEKMERELVMVKEQLEHENALIAEAWYSIAEEIIRNR